MKHMAESKSNDDRDRPEGGIYEVNFGYHPVTEVYTKPSSHIPELSKISNSPSRRKSNLNHLNRAWLRLTETRGKRT